VQPSAGPALPHTRTRTVHWISTTAALAAVVAAVALVEPAGATPRAAPGPSGTPRTSATHPPAVTAAPDADAAVYPLTCAPGAKVDIVDRVAGDLDGDGSPETVAVVRCHSDLGTPPSGVYVLGAPATPGGTPRIAEMLVDPEDRRAIADFRLDGRTVRATVLGYSSDDTPRCCPDLSRTYAWEWRVDRYVALPGPLPGSI
jgi:hypothetical protein